MKKHTYRSEPIQKVRMAEVIPLLEGGCIVAIDVAKEKYMVALARRSGETVKLVRFEHPRETRDFLALVQALQAGLGADRVTAAMEPTGTYGDAVRHQLALRNVPVEMLSPKSVHDSRELFDGVQSLHDAKSAVIVARLCGMGLGSQWKRAEDGRVQMRALVERRAHEDGVAQVCFGRLEGLLARHWPELGRWLDIREHRSAQELLVKYGSPTALAGDEEGARRLLHKVSRGRFSEELKAGVVNDARETLGVPATERERKYIQALAEEALETSRKAAGCEHEMHEHGQADSEFVVLEKWMGTYTAAVMTAFCPPSQYTSASQMEKACGLNLREKSSGEHKGRLMITKRGPGLVRQVLYMFALRMLQSSPVVEEWYRRREGYTAKTKKRAVIAVMRKLVRATFHVAKGEAFEPEKLFDVKKLEIKPREEKKRVFEVRTKPRAIARGRKPSRATA